MAFVLHGFPGRAGSAVRRQARVGAAFATALCLLTHGVPAVAQGADCRQLRNEIASISRGDPGRDARYARAIQQQHVELARTQSYADQIGCGRGFTFFGDSAPTQCDAIEARIMKMENNLAALEGQSRISRNGDPDRAAELGARYDAYCRGSDPAAQDPFGGMDAAADPNAPIIDDGASDDQPTRGGSKAVCVRTCDGGFFPLTTSARSGQLEGLQSLCSALCPNTEAKLYTTGDTDNIGAAVATDGTPYTALPAAFKFQKSFDAACTCKPPGKSWVEALAQAEQLLGKTQDSDVTVTEKMSADMSRPTLATPIPPKKGKKNRKVQLDMQAAAAEGALGAVAAQAPTASKDSSGIAEGDGNAAPMVRTGEGSVKTVPGPDGATRRVRIIAPTL